MAENLAVSDMTWTETEEVLKDRPVGLLPLGSTQAQGPHLPLCADTLVAIEMARRGAAKLRERSIPSLILPPISYGVAGLTTGIPGTIGLPPEAATAFLRDLAIAAGPQFRTVALVHLNVEPVHVECVRKAVEEARKTGASVCHTDFTKKRWAEMLGETFMAGEHAGSVVTSIMMAFAGDRVRDSVRISLPPVEGVQAALKKGAKSLVDAGAEDGYYGDPTAASREDGETYLESLAEVVSMTVMESLGSKA
jgi:creatinine amidohydrolase/Fe(II)-dependent formamide hydrolase-like protein